MRDTRPESRALGARPAPHHPREREGARYPAGSVDFVSNERKELPYIFTYWKLFVTQHQLAIRKVAALLDSERGEAANNCKAKPGGSN